MPFFRTSRGRGGGRGVGVAVMIMMAKVKGMQGKVEARVCTLMMILMRVE